MVTGTEAAVMVELLQKEIHWVSRVLVNWSWLLVV